ncbi:chitin elicitor-binding protein-like [Triticum urartu]|uniref:chitin elicitor-binding protein-like n=1 Tax=Triticum urartu TaxID=4572 RepID=UPI00204355C2|nr:chitin elicitor-binding protein-like [Triticum urartu]
MRRRLDLASCGGGWISRRARTAAGARVVRLEFWVPQPCTCDPVGGDPVVHLTYVAPAGSSVAGIANEYGTTEETILVLNRMPDAKSLLVGQVFDVPLRAALELASCGRGWSSCPPPAHAVRGGAWRRCRRDRARAERVLTGVAPSVHVRICVPHWMHPPSAPVRGMSATRTKDTNKQKGTKYVSVWSPH